MSNEQVVMKVSVAVPMHEYDARQNEGFILQSMAHFFEPFGVAQVTVTTDAGSSDEHKAQHESKLRWIEQGGNIGERVDAELDASELATLKRHKEELAMAVQVVRTSPHIRAFLMTHDAQALRIIDKAAAL